MPTPTDKPAAPSESEDAGTGPDRNFDRPAPDADIDQLVRSRTPQLVPPGTIIEDDEADQQVGAGRTGVVDQPSELDADVNPRGLQGEYGK